MFVLGSLLAYQIYLALIIQLQTICAFRKCKVQTNSLVSNQIIPSIVCYCRELQASGIFSFSVDLPISSQPLLSVSLFISLVAS